MRIALGLAAALFLGGCPGTNDATGDGANCGSAAYVGQVDILRNTYPEGTRGARPSVSLGGLAVYAPGAGASGYHEPNNLIFGGDPSFVASCVGAAGRGHCCYVGPPPDAGDESSGNLGIELSLWNVTVTNVSNPDAGSHVEEDVFGDGGGLSPPGGDGDFPGSLRIYDWTGGDELLVEGSGAGSVEAFSAQITSPPDFEGLGPDVVFDGGTVSLGGDLAVTWSPGGAESVTLNALDVATSGLIICVVPDNGSFTIPSSQLSHFQSGDQGGLAIFRTNATCAHSGNAAISILAQTQTLVGVEFQ